MFFPTRALIIFSAKHMVRRVPSFIPYVKLGECFRPTISDLRKQTKVGRVTTAEALALLFEVTFFLGEFYEGNARRWGFFFGFAFH